MMVFRLYGGPSEPSTAGQDGGDCRAADSCATIERPQRRTGHDPGVPHHFMIRRILASQQAGLVLVILLLGAVLSAFAGTHLDRTTGQTVNDFLNSYTLIQTATDASFFAVMAVGATIVIISGGIDLSVGSIYALAGVTA